MSVKVLEASINIRVELNDRMSEARAKNLVQLHVDQINRGRNDANAKVYVGPGIKYGIIDEVR